MSAGRLRLWGLSLCCWERAKRSKCRYAQALQEGGILFDLLRKLPLTDRYTFNFQGNSQALDHVYVSPALRRRSLADVLHVNTGLVTQPTDHDPVTAVVRAVRVYDSAWHYVVALFLLWCHSHNAALRLTAVLR